MGLTHVTVVWEVAVEAGFSLYEVKYYAASSGGVHGAINASNAFTTRRNYTFENLARDVRYSFEVGFKYYFIKNRTFSPLNMTLWILQAHPEKIYPMHRCPKKPQHF